MQYDDATAMAYALVREHGTPAYVQKLVKAAFGTAPSIKRIAQMRADYVNNDPTYRRSSYNAQPIPEDFAEVAPTMCKYQLLRHYGVKWSGTIDRWCKESGVEAKKYVAPKRNRLSMMGRVHVPAEFVKPKDEYEVAADVLRKERYPVNRCNDNGLYNATGKFWRVGRNVLTPEQLLEKAERYGR